MTKTQNYQLNQWEASDYVRREDFNADNAKLDAAIRAAVDGGAKTAAGTYTGDGAAQRTVSLPFTPKAVYVCLRNGAVANSSGTNYFGGLAVTGSPAAAMYDTDPSPVAIVEGGFQVAYKALNNHNVMTNDSGRTYHYAALG